MSITPSEPKAWHPKKEIMSFFCPKCPGTMRTQEVEVNGFMYTQLYRFFCICEGCGHTEVYDIDLH